MLAAKDSKDVELLGSEVELLEQTIAKTIQPIGSVGNIDAQLLLFAFKFFLMYCFF